MNKPFSNTPSILFISSSKFAPILSNHAYNKIFPLSVINGPSPTLDCLISSFTAPSCFTFSFISSIFSLLHSIGTGCFSPKLFYKFSIIY